uniref:Uncharacterized protein n=1 Tax=Caenorhabditis japonica TaxID=281687 RepID=A0A8R1IH84_CAEJA
MKRKWTLCLLSYLFVLSNKGRELWLSVRFLRGAEQTNGAFFTRVLSLLAQYQETLVRTLYRSPRTFTLKPHGETSPRPWRRFDERPVRLPRMYDSLPRLTYHSIYRLSLRGIRMRANITGEDEIDVENKTNYDDHEHGDHQVQV